MTEVLAALPEKSKPYIQNLMVEWPLGIKITKERFSKHGDYRKHSNGNHEITLNKTDNPYRFLITLLHEIAHFITFEKFGNRIKPHGKEWKQVYKELMVPLLHPEIFPKELLAVLAAHFKNPKAATDTDFNLVCALHRYDSNPDKTYIFELNEGEVFTLTNGRKFIRGPQRRKRFECTALPSHKKYLVSPHAVVKREKI